MLHVSHRSGQARRARRAGATALLLAFALATPALAPAQNPPPTLAQAAALAQSGDHLVAAARYEQLARRGFMNWDTETALLAAREYAIGGALADAERLAGKVRDRVRTEVERTLLLEVDARLALERNDPTRALVALRALPTPLPPEAAADLLALRARAEFAAGDPLSGVRTFEERAAAVPSATEVADNDRLLFEQLRQHPPGPITQGGISERERGWLELPGVVAAAGAAQSSPNAAPAALVQQWLQQHPGHPGAAFIPGASAAGTGAQGYTVGDGSAGNVALLLPLSGKQQPAGAAVRDGFTAAWFATGSGDARPRVDVYDTAALGAAQAYQRAIAGGARVVVGPLTKEDIAAVLAAQPAGLPVPTLALNSVTTPGMTAPAFLYQFALDPEQEARAVARRIAQDGLERGVALFPDNAWGQRLRTAFTEELQATGTVTLLSAQFYAPGAKDYSGPLRTALGRYGGAGDRSSGQPAPARNAAAEQATGPQFAFVAATPQAARAIRPQLRFQMTYDLPLYTTSDAWDPSVRAAADMDGMVFPEMPWLLYAGQGAPELWDAVQEEWSTRSRGRLRLYAFGYDAYRLARQFGGPGSFVAGVDGLTGLLEVNSADGRVQRNLQFARIEGGKPQVAGAGLPVIPALPATNAAGTPPSN